MKKAILFLVFLALLLGSFSVFAYGVALLSQAVEPQKIKITNPDFIIPETTNYNVDQSLGIILVAVSFGLLVLVIIIGLIINARKQDSKIL